MVSQVPELLNYQLWSNWQMKEYYLEVQGLAEQQNEGTGVAESKER